MKGHNPKRLLRNLVVKAQEHKAIFLTMSIPGSKDAALAGAAAAMAMGQQMSVSEQAKGIVEGAKNAKGKL